jgi:CBS domain-containing protein
LDVERRSRSLGNRVKKRPDDFRRKGEQVMTIAAILQGKGSDVIRVGPTDSVLSAVRLLAEQRIGCVPVVENGQVVGIFSERDLVYRVAQDGPAALDHSVGEVMTAPAITIDDQTPIMHSLSLMTKRRIRHLPVVVDGALAGMISIGDLVKYRIDSIESEAASLRDYIQTA